MPMNDDFCLKVVVARDSRPIYPLWCRIFGHRWVRYGYEVTPSRPRSCHRCEDIGSPRYNELRRTDTYR